MTKSVNRFLLEFNNRFDPWRRTIVAFLVPTVILGTREGPTTLGEVGVVLFAAVLLSGAFPKLLPRRLVEITDWMYVCIESLLASLLPSFGYAIWAPAALIPHLLNAGVVRKVLVAGSCVASALLGQYLWSLFGGYGAFRLSAASAPVLSIIVLLVVLVYLDSWKEREAQQRRELSNRLESINRRVSTLAHEVKTPLSVLQTSSALLLEERPGKLTKDQLRLVQQIDNGVLRLIHFADNLIAGIKVDQKWFPLNREYLDLRKIVKRVAEQVRPLLSQRGQRLKLSFPSLVSRIRGDSQWLEQVMVNLIHNAAKYADPGVVIDVSVRENEQWVVCSVGDNGVGISGDERFQVFTEFYQGNVHTGAQVNGSGLGLAIVKRVVERHGGEVFVGSVEGIGTIISFTLPKGVGTQ